MSISQQMLQATADGVAERTTNLVLDRLLAAVETEEEGAVLRTLMRSAGYLKKCESCGDDHREKFGLCMTCSVNAIRAEQS